MTTRTRQNRTRLQPGDGDPRHGTVNGYTNLRCRCGRCRLAWQKYQIVLRARRWESSRQNGGVAPGDRMHGKVCTYWNWGCRCGPCKVAHKIEYDKSNAKRAEKRRQR